MARGADWRSELTAELKGMPLEAVFQRYEAGYGFPKRSQSAYLREIMSRTNLVEFLAAQFKKDLLKPDTKARISGREKAASIAGMLGERAKPLVPLLVAALEDEESVRMRVTQALAAMGPLAIEAKPALLEELHFQNSQAAMALFKIDPTSEEVLKAVIDAVSDKSKEQMFRSQTLDAFHQCKVKSDRAKKFLETIANDEADQYRQTAKNQLQLMDYKTKRWVAPKQPSYTEKDVPMLLEFLKLNPENYQHAEALSKLGPDARKEAVALLMDALKKGKIRFPGNVIGYFRLFGTEAKPALPMLIEHARGDDSSLANNGMSGIGAIGPAAIEAKPVVEAALADGSAMTRWRAAYTLCQIDPDRMEAYLPKMMETFEEREAPPMGDIRQYGLRTLGEFGPRAAKIAPQMEKYLQQEETRMAAAWALMKIQPEGNSKLAPIVVKELKNDSLHVRDDAARLLGEMGEAAREVLPQLREAASGDDLELAKIANESIRKIEEAK